MFGGLGGGLDRLMIAYRFKMSRGADGAAGDGWAYNWSYAECSTSHPTPRDGYATMFLIVNMTNSPIADLTLFIDGVNRCDSSVLRGGKLKLTLSDHSEDDSKKELTIKQGKNVVLTGVMTAVEFQENTGSATADPNVGNYAQLESNTMHGMWLLRVMQQCAAHGYCTVIDHAKIQMNVYNGCKLVATTGDGPEGDRKGLATRFLLYNAHQEEVARCHLSYRDGSWDSSMGPTVEMIAVHKDYRGQGYLPILWHWVFSFIQENFLLECMNNDTSPCNIMIKATQLTNVEIERKGQVPVTDKDFFYEYLGFSVRMQKGAAALLAPGRPKDEEAVLYTPLLTRSEVDARSSLPTDTACTWTNHRGARTCECCERLSASHSRCTRCRTVFYCNKDCQKRDWVRGDHKSWCGKTEAEVRAILIERGLLVA